MFPKLIRMLLAIAAATLLGGCAATAPLPTPTGNPKITTAHTNLDAAEKAEREKQDAAAVECAINAYLQQAIDGNGDATINKATPETRNGQSYTVTMYGSDSDLESHFVGVRVYWRGHVTEDGGNNFKQDSLTVEHISLQEAIAAAGADTPRIDKPANHRQ